MYVTAEVLVSYQLRTVRVRYVSITAIKCENKRLSNRRKNFSLRTLSREYECLANIGTKEALLLGN